MLSFMTTLSNLIIKRIAPFRNLRNHPKLHRSTELKKDTPFKRFSALAHSHVLPSILSKASASKWKKRLTLSTYFFKLFIREASM